MDQLPIWISAHALTVIAALLLLVAAGEAYAPRQRADAVGLRWATNIVIYAATLLALRALPAGLFGRIVDPWDVLAATSLGRPGAHAAAFLAGFLLLDLLTYLLHRMQHLGPFWRLHHVHHSDHALDASTGLRHHPGEAVVNGLLGGTVTIALGIPLWVAPVYVLLLNLANLLQHANLDLPPKFDRWLARVVMTPGAHRLHHSEAPEHFNTNFGAVLAVWDRVFDTWHDQVADPLRYGVSGVPPQGPLAALAAPLLLRQPASVKVVCSVRTVQNFAGNAGEVLNRHTSGTPPCVARPAVVPPSPG